MEGGKECGTQPTGRPLKPPNACHHLCCHWLFLEHGCPDDQNRDTSDRRRTRMAVSAVLVIFYFLSWVGGRGVCYIGSTAPCPYPLGNTGLS